MRVEIAGQAYANGMEPELLAEIFPPKVLRRLPSFPGLGLCAAIKALQSASLFPAPQDMGIVIGTRFGPQNESFNYMDSIIEDGPGLSMPMAFANSVNNAAAGMISHLLQIQGPAFTLNNEGQSLANALQTGIALLSSGRVSHCLVGCMEEEDGRLARLLACREQSWAYFLILKNADV